MVCLPLSDKIERAFSRKNESGFWHLKKHARFGMFPTNKVTQAWESYRLVASCKEKGNANEGIVPDKSQLQRKSNANERIVLD